MPFKNWHSARLIWPDDLSKHYANKTIAPGIQLILGKYPYQRKTVTQAIRFSVKKFTPNDVKKWIKRHKKYKVLKYEFAANNNPGLTHNVDELHKMFLGREAASEFDIELEQMQELAQIGKVFAIEYTARKYRDKKQHIYRHSFKKKPLLLTNGKELIIFGEFTIEDRGIIG